MCKLQSYLNYLRHIYFSFLIFPCMCNKIKAHLFSALPRYRVRSKPMNLTLHPRGWARASILFSPSQWQKTSGPWAHCPLLGVWLPGLSAGFDNAVSQSWEVLVTLEASLRCGREVRLVGWFILKESFWASFLFINAHSFHCSGTFQHWPGISMDQLLGV